MTAGRPKRALYAGGRLGGPMRLWNRLDARLHALGVADAEYMVSMLGPAAHWVRNIEAADGQAVLRRRGRDIPVHTTFRIRWSPTAPGPDA